MQDLQLASVFFGIVGTTFVFLALLLFRKGVNKINFFFILGTVAIAIASFLCMFAFGGFVPTDLKNMVGAIGNTMMFWAPVAFFFSGIMILYGTNIITTKFPLLVIGGYLILTVFYISSNLDLNRGLVAGALVIAFGLLLNIVVYLKVYKEIPEQRTNLTFLLGGMGVSLIALLVQVIQKESISILPMEFDWIPGITINIGILIFILAFTSLPSKVVSEKPVIS